MGVLIEDGDRYWMEWREWMKEGQEGSVKVVND